MKTIAVSELKKLIREIRNEYKGYNSPYTKGIRDGLFLVERGVRDLQTQGGENERHNQRSSVQGGNRGS